LEKWKKGRGMGKTTIFFLPSLRIQNRGDREAGRWRGEGRRRPGARRRAGSGAKRRGGRGQLIPLLTLVEDGLWREIDGGGRSSIETARAALVVAMEGSGRRGDWSWRCGVLREAAQGL
jgi:hypothetical protein